MSPHKKIGRKCRRQKCCQQAQNEPEPTLRHMRTGQSATIKCIKCPKGKGEIVRRLRDMGLTPGLEIIVKGRAPLFDPVAIKVRGNDLSLRNGEADLIQVDLPEAAA